MNKLKYQPITGFLTYQSNGKPYKKDDAIDIAFELGRGYKSVHPLGLEDPSRGLVLDNIITVKAPVDLPEGITTDSKGIYQVEYDNIVYGYYRDLEVAKRVLALAERGYKRRTAKNNPDELILKRHELVNVLNFIANNLEE